MSNLPIVIRPESLHSFIAQELMQDLNSELSLIYPEEGANHFRLDHDEVIPGRGVFLVAHLGAEAVGCGAVRRIDEGTGEIKRMYVLARVRGQHIGKALLTALEREVRALGIHRLILETGARQVEAVALYHRAGFRRVPCFGEYADSRLSLCMAKDLS